MCVCVCAMDESFGVLLEIPRDKELVKLKFMKIIVEYVKKIE